MFQKNKRKVEPASQNEKIKPKTGVRTLFLKQQKNVFWQGSFSHPGQDLPYSIHKSRDAHPFLHNGVVKRGAGVQLPQLKDVGVLPRQLAQLFAQSKDVPCTEAGAAHHHKVDVGVGGASPRA
mgnify:CR=1 FL=1